MTESTTTPPLRTGPVLAVLFGAPLLLLLLRTPGLPTADVLAQHVSLDHLTPRLQNKVSVILFVPLGAMLVVFFRLTLGIRVLGPFRSLLLAAAFQTTGILLGLVFLVVTGGIVVAARAPIQAMKLPYFGRYTVMLSVVAAVMIAGVLASAWLEMAFLRGIVSLPLVVLCLIADAFARTIKKEGLASAAWRGATTAAIAALLTVLADLPQLRRLLLAYPELLIAQIGCIVVISKFLAFRCLKALNPHQGDGEGDEDPDESEDEVKRKPKPAAAPTSLTFPPLHLSAERRTAAP